MGGRLGTKFSYSIHALLLIDPHSEDSLVVVELKDVPEAEDVSETREECPDAVSL